MNGEAYRGDPLWAEPETGVFEAGVNFCYNKNT